MKRVQELSAILTILIGMLTIGAAIEIEQRIETEARAAFQTHVIDFRTSIESRLRSYEDILFGLAALFQEDPYVSSSEFAAYASSLDMKRRYPALEVVNYAEYIRGGQESPPVPSLPVLRAAKAPERLAATPSAADRMVITRSYPQDVPGLGFDLMSKSWRLPEDPFPLTFPGLYKPNRPISSGMRIFPYGKQVPCLAARLGVFKTGLGGKRYLAGTVGIGFKIQNLFDEAIPAGLKGRLHFKVSTAGRTDGTQYVPPVALFAMQQDGTQQSVQFNNSFMMPFGGALLRFDLAESRSELLNQADRILPPAILAFGLLLVLLTNILFRNAINANKKLTQAVARRTQELTDEIEARKALERQIDEVAEKERSRIGRELHDDLGQRLTAISLASRILYERLGDPDLLARANFLEQQTTQAINTVRSLAHGLMPVAPVHSGLRDALERMAHSINVIGLVRCVFDFDDPVDIRNEYISANLYRIAQEAVNNAQKHAAATQIDIRLDYEDDEVVLIVRDNGKGFSHDGLAGEDKGAGLKIMAYRASVIGFRLNIESNPENGTTIELRGSGE